MQMPHISSLERADQAATICVGSGTAYFPQDFQRLVWVGKLPSDDTPCSLLPQQPFQVLGGLF